MAFRHFQETGSGSLNKIHVAIVPPYYWDLNCRNGAYSRLHRKICHMLTTVNNMYGLLTKREVKMAGYWPSSFFAFLWTETKSRSINTQKKNEANIQPS